MRMFDARPACLPLILVVGLLAGCPDDESVGPSARRPAPTPRPSGDVQGGVDTDSSGPASVRHVILTPEAVTLNAPAADGTTPAGLAHAQQFEAQAVLSDGATDSRGVTWSVSNPALLGISAGLLTVKPGTPAGSYAVTATSLGTPAMAQTAIVQVVTDGLLRVQVEPESSGALQRTLTIVQDGRFVHYQGIQSSADIRLPSGGGYVAQVPQPSGEESKLGTRTDLGISPNGITPVTITLP